MTEQELRREINEIRDRSIRTDERSKSNTHRLDEVETNLKSIKETLMDIKKKIDAKPGIRFWAPLLVPLLIPAITLVLILMGFQTS